MTFRYLGLSVALTALLLSGCGGSSSDSTVPSSTASSALTGTVATGQGLVADLVIIDAAGHRATGVSDENGTYSIQTVGMTQPIMIQATVRTTGDLMYSFASNTSGVLNVTPLTTFIVDQAAVAASVAGGASQLFQNFAASATAVVSEIAPATTTLNGVISSTMGDLNVSGFNHFTGAFAANHTGYDAMLDALDIEIDNDDVVIRQGTTTLDTIDYDISATTIDVTGRIVTTSGTAISGASIRAVDGAGHEINATTDNTGVFSAAVDTMRNYTVTITAPGYETQIIPNVSSFALTNQYVGTISMFSSSATGTTAFSGTVIDGRTAGTAISGATLTFREGYNARVGTSVAAATTAADGTYTVAALPVGNYTVEIVKAGFDTRYMNVVVDGATMSGQNFSLIGEVTTTAGTTNGFASIVLNWGANPGDLDSHLTGPSTTTNTTTTGRFHVYYDSQLYTNDGSGATDLNATNPCGTANVVASLDRDDTDSYGPETTTLCRPVDGGLYKYYIHHYSGSSTISDSSASVTLTLANGTSRTFTPPSGATGSGSIWHVFNFDANGNVYPVNAIIGSGGSTSTLFASSSRILDSRFRADNNLFLTLPRK